MHPFVRALTIGGVITLFVQTVSAQDQKRVDAGEAVYNDYCSNCHGLELVSTGQSFDLRRLRRKDRQRFENSVLNGKGQMPPWKGVLEADQIDALWAYITSIADNH